MNTIRYQLCLMLCFVTMPAFAVIVFDGSEGAAPLDHPSSSVIGKGPGACSVAIAPNYIICTRHQGGSVGDPVTFGGQTYQIEEEFPHASADLRVLRIAQPDGSTAELKNYVTINDHIFELSKTAIIGGTGVVRGAPLEAEGIVYGYDWTNNVSDKVTWGQNRIAGTRRVSDKAFTSSVAIAFFDDSSDKTHVYWEAVPAGVDSGSGWFLKKYDTWYLIGISRAVEHGDVSETWFRDKDNPHKLKPNYVDAVRIKPYAEWIKKILQTTNHTNDTNK